MIKHSFLFFCSKAFSPSLILCFSPKRFHLKKRKRETRIRESIGEEVKSEIHFTTFFSSNAFFWSLFRVTFSFLIRWQATFGIYCIFFLLFFCHKNRVNLHWMMTNHRNFLQKKLFFFSRWKQTTLSQRFFDAADEK